ncbi:hypothetical protein P7K49_020355 [Saguinus oedipus]|uniref:Uncharacterized protein n=1 Tax=Saguinus oedipus TaxID=9490 RepID=A0ABQ9V022_SAGOE|nr:hypothetical protein P7K49_020355 [Saguinus oedipus]
MCPAETTVPGLLRAAGSSRSQGRCRHLRALNEPKVGQAAKGKRKLKRGLGRWSCYLDLKDAAWGAKESLQGREGAESDRGDGDGEREGEGEKSEEKRREKRRARGREREVEREGERKGKREREGGEKGGEEREREKERQERKEGEVERRRGERK